MPKDKTVAFANCEQLVAKLKKRDWKRSLKELHSKNPDLGPLTAIYHSVGKSTFRAFPKYKNCKPSVVFRQWAVDELFHDGLEALHRVRSHDQYHEWAVGVARSLAKEWQKRLMYSLEIPRALKLVNLLAKGLCVVSPFWQSYEKLVWHIHVPLDMYSLRPLSCLPDLANIGIRWSDASMGSVKDLKTYTRIQDSILEFCSRANVPPLAYDFLAWDSTH